MTARKELFTAVSLALEKGGDFELIELYKQQFQNPENNPFGSIYTAAFIKISNLTYSTRTNQSQDGKGMVSIYITTKEGFSDQFSGTPDKDHGLAEIDLIDNTLEALQFLQGEAFTQFELISEAQEESPLPGLFIYRLDFETELYNELKPNYVFNKE